MADSFSFNEVDMSAYGLRLRTHEEPFAQETPAVQMLDRAYGFNSLRLPIQFTLDVAISAADKATLLSYLDSIKQTLNERCDCKLALDTFDDRYWMARFTGIYKTNNTAKTWEGTIDFTANDPAAYDNTETDHDHTIDEDPEELTETAGGTEKVEPVITLTCDDTLSDTTVEIENAATGEAFEWTGDLVATDVLIINCVTGYVTLNGAASMGTVDGQFIHLLPGDNVITVTGFSGTLNFTYRKRYV